MGNLVLGDPGERSQALAHVGLVGGSCDGSHASKPMDGGGAEDAFVLVTPEDLHNVHLPVVLLCLL